MTLSHSALAASGLSVDEGLKAVTVICVQGWDRTIFGWNTWNDLVKRITGIDGQCYDGPCPFCDPGSCWTPGRQARDDETRTDHFSTANS